MIDFDFKKHCYGCGLCQAICPKGAIKIEENENGFFNPVINQKKCINCGLCQKKCLFLNENTQKSLIESDDCYAVQIRDVENLKNSSSGGVFFEIARSFINNGGYVSGCVWDQNMMPKHILSHEIADIYRMQGSKYVQSDINFIYDDIKKRIKSNQVLFVGTPCQVSAIRKYLNNASNLYTISLICEGVPSRKVWRLYKKKLESQSHSSIVNVNFRNKDNCGWLRPDSVYRFSSGQEKKFLSFNLDYYVSSFISGLTVNSKCFNCNLKGRHNDADLIIGDFWKIPHHFFNKKTKNGVSCVIINNAKGKKLFQLIDQLDFQKVDIDLIANGNPNLNGSIKKPLLYNTFFDNLDNLDIMDNFKKCNKELNSCKKRILRILFQLKIIRFLKK